MKRIIYLFSDRNEGIARIDYDMNNHPVRIQFTNGNVDNIYEMLFNIFEK